jgi:NAD(P)-dependent dehydrogenase (short-subunit alcohol dehydrogenase family)
MIGVNLTGMFLVNQTAAQWMRANKRKGSIINTASMSGSIINRAHGEDKHMMAYNVSKYGVVGLTKAMAMGFVQDGIRFNSISPGYMFSGIHDTMDPARIRMWESDVPMGRFGSMDEIGGLVAFLASDISGYMTGSDVIIDGGYTVW